MTALICANLAATAIRFLIYRHWVFRQRQTGPASGPPPAAGPALPVPAHPGSKPLATVTGLTTETNGDHQ